MSIKKLISYTQYTVPGLGGNDWSSCMVCISSEDVELISLSVLFVIKLDLYTNIILGISVNVNKGISMTLPEPRYRFFVDF